MFSKEDLKEFKINVVIPKEELRDREQTHDDLIDKGIEYNNKYMKWWGEFFKGAYEIHRKYNAEMWFLVISI